MSDVKQIKVELEEFDKARQDERQKIEDRLIQAINDAKDPVIKQIKAQIEEFGITPSELGFNVVVAPKASKKGVKGPVRPAKYANPNDSSITWSGFGRMPEWFKAHQSGGGKKEELLISKG